MDKRIDWSSDNENLYRNKQKEEQLNYSSVHYIFGYIK